MPKPSDPPPPSLYRKYFTPAERRALNALPGEGITSEIDLMRVVLARNFGNPAASPNDMPSRLKALRARAHAASLIAALLRTQVFTLDARGYLDRMIKEALADVSPFLDDPEDGGRVGLSSERSERIETRIETTPNQKEPLP